LNEPVEFATALAAGGGVEYTRHDARNSRAFEQVLGALEGGEAVLYASGMAAISAVLDVLAPASVDRADVLYSGTRALFASRGLPHGAGLTWIESPSNPDLRVTDIAAVARTSTVAVVDNTFATPLGQRPLALGADVVVHSVSKFLSGHSDVLLGAVVCRDEQMGAQFRRHRELGGAIPGPMEAWLALRGMRTLDVRLRRASANAAVIAQRLAHRSDLRVIWPGLPDHPDHALAVRQMDVMTPVFALIPDGGPARAEQICAGTRLWTHATSLGGVESTLERRRRHAAESDLVDPALIRASVGIEDVEDLWEDLRSALDASL
jgi:cystathionine gamma-synthase